VEPVHKQQQRECLLVQLLQGVGFFCSLPSGLLTISLFDNLLIYPACGVEIFFLNMATYDTLPIYKASYELLVEIFQFTQNFSREFKYTLGERLKNETIDMITNIYRANTRQNKFDTLQKARENIEIIRLYMRLLKDLKQVGLKKFVNINERIENVSKQLTGWQKSVKSL
jgi:hypothetical protein